MVSTRVAVPLGALMLGGAALRLWALSGEPFDFHTDRQLYDVLMARAFWVDLGGTPPPGTFEAIRAARSEVIEPPVTQLGGALLYLAAGGESVWLVRAVLSLLWVAAAVPLTRAVTLLTGRQVVGLLAAASWLLTPFGVVASRSFQPDGPALVCGVLSIAAMVRYDEDLRPRHWWSGALWASAAAFVKVTAVFVVVPVYVALVLRREGVHGLVARRAIGFGAVTVAPALLYLGVGHLAGTGTEQTGGRIVPSLLLEGEFWSRWLTHAGAVVGFTGCAVLVVGLVVARDRLRAVLLGLTVGYVVFGLLFTYHYSTHSYYHLPLVLPVAIAWAVVAARVVDALRGSLRPLAVAGALLVVASVGELLLVPAARQAVAGPSAGWTASVLAAEEAGEELEHSTDVIFLTPHYGHEYEAYGYLAGTWWPSTADLAKERLEGTADPGPDLRLDRLRGLDGDPGPEWFLADVDELAKQPDLATWLDDRYAVGAGGAGWVAYRLD